MHMYVLLPFVNAVPAAGINVLAPLFSLGEPPLIPYNPDSISFSCMQPFDKHVLASRPSIHGEGEWSQPLLMQLTVTPTVTPV